jgi:hypothetical protein
MITDFTLNRYYNNYNIRDKHYVVKSGSLNSGAKMNFYSGVTLKALVLFFRISAPEYFSANNPLATAELGVKYTLNRKFDLGAAFICLRRMMISLPT